VPKFKGLNPAVNTGTRKMNFLTKQNIFGLIEEAALFSFIAREIKQGQNVL
jgi:hypothetical protein